MSTQPEPSARDQASSIFVRLAGGEAGAADDLLPLVYAELRVLAQRHMARERNDHTLQATALVHEAYARLVGGTRESFADRSHFFRAAAQSMRALLVDHARARLAKKRGGGERRVQLDESLVLDDERLEDCLAIDEALKQLALRDPELTRLVELRFFAGLSNDEIAEVLRCSTRTVERSWRTARAFLRSELGDE